MTDAALPPPMDRAPERSAAARFLAANGFAIGGPALRAGVVAALALLLSLPLGFVKGVVEERRERFDAAAREIAESWGGRQTFAGPVLVLPYRSADTGTTNVAAILPDSLLIAARVVPELRSRGIFGAIVYTVEIEVSGVFPPLETFLAGRAKRVDWTAAAVRFAVDDPRSLRADDGLQLGGQIAAFEPAGATELGRGAIAAAAAGLETVERGNPIRFSARFRLNGSEALAFLPLGRDTAVTVEAPWPAPSFAGAFLPGEREVGDTGFSARWRISQLGTGLARVHDSYDGGARLDPKALARSAFGVAFLQPVHGYRETERAAKYGLLFVALTLGTWLLFELVFGARAHLLQYGLVGLSLCVFYLLLLSFAERLGFASAYALAAAAVVLQSALYTGFATRRARLGLAFGGLSALLYGYLFVLLRLETLSLIGGSVLLFAALGAAMWATRDLAAGRAMRQADGTA